MTKIDMKQRIAAMFISMVKESSLSQVRIADLISSLHINRNTFYYHFASKYEVAMWILRYDLARELSNELPTRQLIYAPINENDSTELPYYVHIEIAARTLDSAPFFKAFSRCVLLNQDFYRKIFNLKEKDFLDLVARQWRDAFHDDICFILDKRYMPEETRRMLADMAVRHLIFRIEYILENAKDAEILFDDAADPFWNLLHESLHIAIQKHPINRKPSRSRYGSFEPIAQ